MHSIRQAVKEAVLFRIVQVEYAAVFYENFSDYGATVLQHARLQHGAPGEWTAIGHCRIRRPGTGGDAGESHQKQARS